MCKRIEIDTLDPISQFILEFTGRLQQKRTSLLAFLEALSYLMLKFH